MRITVQTPSGMYLLTGDVYFAAEALAPRTRDSVTFRYYIAFMQRDWSQRHAKIWIAIDPSTWMEVAVRDVIKIEDDEPTNAI